jgi:hypothetical protein
VKCLFAVCLPTLLAYPAARTREAKMFDVTTGNVVAHPPMLPEVAYLAYCGRLQAEALASVSSKMRSSLMVEGELPKDGPAPWRGTTRT